jgi:hypothetical protein
MARTQLLRRPLADTDVEHLALADDVGEGLHRLLERCLVVVAVRLIKVDVVGLQPGQRAVDRLEDVLAGQADVVVTLGPGRAEHLGEDLQRFTPFTLERLAEHGLGLGVGVHVGGVERRYAGVQGRAHTLCGDVVFHLRAVREPVAIGDLRDLETGGAEVAEVHRHI